MAFSPTVGAAAWGYVRHPRRTHVYPSRADNRITTHPSCPAAARARPFTCRRASTTYANSSPAKAEHVYVRAGGLICRPILGGCHGGKVLHHPSGLRRQEIISLDRLKAHTSPSPVSPAETASRGCPPEKPAAILQSSLRHHEAGGGGGPVEDRRSTFKNIYLNMSLTIMVPVKQ